MSELRPLLERTRDELRPEPRGFDRLAARRRRHQRRQRIAAATMSLAVALGALLLVVQAFWPVTPRPAGVADGDEIAFVRLRHPTAGELTHAIYVVPVDGGTPRVLTPGDANYMSPAWSPDGRTLAFVRLAEDDGVDEGIYALDVATGEQRRLLTTGDPKPVSVWDLGWSPDGARIAYIYARYPDGPGPQFEAETELRLFVMNADGSSPQPLTPTDIHVSSFSWSPDASRIAYAVQSVEPGGTRFSTDIWVMDLGTGESWPLTSDGSSDEPAWSPTGDRLAFVRHSDGYRRSDVYLASSNGIAVWRLTDTEEREFGPEWSPDGTELVFGRIGDAFESCRLMVASAVTGEERELAGFDALGGCPESPAWEPNVEPPAVSSAEEIVWDQSYTLSSLRVAFPAPATGSEGDLGGAQALVSFDARWSGSVYPGEAACTVTLYDDQGKEVARSRFNFATSAPSTQGQEVMVPVDDGVPVSAAASCGPGTRPTGDYVFSDLRVEQGTNAPRLVGHVSWGSLRPPLEGWCQAHFRRTDGSTTSYVFTLRTGEGELTVLLTDDLLDATVLGVECEPYAGQQRPAE